MLQLTFSLSFNERVVISATSTILIGNKPSAMGYIDAD